MARHSDRADLTDRQRRFIDEYLVDLNGADAARRAGYSASRAKNEAFELLNDPRIQAAVKAAIDERRARVQLDQDYVLGNLIEVTERCMQRAPVMKREGRAMVQATDEEGRHVWEFNASGATKALELLGKHLALFTEKHQHSGHDGGAIKIEPTEAATELAKILAGIKQRKGEA